MLIFLLPAIFCDYFLLIHIYFIVRLSVYPRPCTGRDKDPFHDAWIRSFYDLESSDEGSTWTRRVWNSLNGKGLCLSRCKLCLCKCLQLTHTAHSACRNVAHIYLRYCPVFLIANIGYRNIDSYGRVIVRFMSLAKALVMDSFPTEKWYW